jgi:hypothetical protein
VPRGIGCRPREGAEVSKNGSSAGGKSGAGRRSKTRAHASTERGTTNHRSPSQHAEHRRNAERLPPNNRDRPLSRKEARLAKIAATQQRRAGIHARQTERAKAKASKAREKTKAQRAKAKKVERKAARAKSAALFKDLSKKAKAGGHHAEASHYAKAAKRLKKNTR